MLDVVTRIYVPVVGFDRKVRTASMDGSFSVSSLYSTRVARPVFLLPLSRIWNVKVPLWILAFGWLALHGKILTVDVNACCMCLQDTESIDHLFLRLR